VLRPRWRGFSRAQQDHEHQAATKGCRGRRHHSGKAQMNFDKELDARGLNCPLPILKSKKSLNDMTSGQVLKVVSTDPGSVKDMQAFCKQTGNPLLSSAEENKAFVFFVQKK
jgi:tRNA 2-thiouridine synthesizing protein A